MSMLGLESQVIPYVSAGAEVTRIFDSFELAEKVHRRLGENAVEDGEPAAVGHPHDDLPDSHPRRSVHEMVKGWDD
jgi:hypothetical protein